MSATDWSQFIGRFHPLFVHLPIGILFTALLFDGMARIRRFASLQPAIPLAYLLGAVSAMLTCLTGYLLSTSGDYDPAAVGWHQWLGLGVAIVSTAIWLLHTYSSTLITIKNGLPILLGFLLILTGHLGGNLTHGAGYLLEYMPPPFKTWLGGSEEKNKTIITNVQEAAVFADVIAPILADKCQQCHGPTKKKGKLRLDTPENIHKGGKSGKPVILAGDPEKSEMIRRILLPETDEDHMPPEEKRQLTPAEIALLRWWIAGNAPFTGKVASMAQSDSIISYLGALEGIQEVYAEEPDKPTVAATYPKVDFGPPELSAVEKLEQFGAVVLPLGRDHNLFSVNFVNVSKDLFPEAIAALQPLSRHIAWLRLSEQPIKDTMLMKIPVLENLTKLYLDHTGITDKGLSKLKNFPQLQYLNLVGNPVTAQGLTVLENLPDLKQLFLFETAVTRSDYSILKTQFPNVAIDTGGYRIEMVEEANTVVKEEK